MIESHEGHLSIEGNKPQVLLDFAHIYDQMIKIAPEIVQSVVMFREKELLNAEVDRTDFAICQKLLNTITSVESEDNDDEDFIL